MNTTHPYLNPVEFFELTAKPGLTAADIRKAKKRFLTELELDGREDFDYHGRLFTRNDLDRVSQETEGEAMLAAYVAAAGAEGLSAFLASGRTDQAFDSGQLFNPRLEPVLKTYFGPAFNQAFGRAVASLDQQTVGKMVLWKAESAGIPLSELYQDSYRNLAAKIETLAGTVEAYLRNPKDPAAQSLRGMKAFEDNFPKSLVSTLPPYFSDLTNKLADRLTPYIVRLNNERNNPRMALALTKSLLRLEYLSEDKRTELKKIGRQLRDNVNVANHNREAKRSNEGRSAGGYVWMIIVVVVMLFRIGSCVAKNSRSSRPSYRSSTPYARQYTTPKPEYYRQRYVVNLRQAVRNGLSPAAVTPDSRANIPIQDIAPVYLPDAGVREANQALRNMGEDTVYHILGHVMYRPSLSFDPDKAFEKAMKRKPAPKDRDTSGLYKILLQLSEEQKEKERVRQAVVKAEELEREERAERNAAEKAKDVAERKANRLAEKRANGIALGKLAAKTLAKQPQSDILGPRARMPANYSLMLKSKLSDRDRFYKHGPIKRIKAGIDDPEMSALLVWRDTFGLRQVRVASTRSVPLVFSVATGRIKNLADGYVVYGKRWSDQETSPWGGEGWYREVLCYCGPEDHGVFTNGKRQDRKNVWFPTRKVDKSKSLSPQAWLRGVKRLR